MHVQGRMEALFLRIFSRSHLPEIVLGFTFSRVDFQNGAEKRYGFYAALRL